MHTPEAPALRSCLAASALALVWASGGAGAALAADPSPGFRYWDPEDTASVPKTLSLTGLYATAPGKDAPLIAAARPFDLNTPAWSDGAKKKRWVILKPGSSIGFREKDDYWDYPDSVVFVKQFDIDTLAGDTASRVPWETRFLVNKKVQSQDNGPVTDLWYGFSYKWRSDRQDADLVDLARGRNDSIRTWPEGTGAGKVARMKRWHFPSIYECQRCHVPHQGETLHGRSVLGFFTAQLNRPDADSAGWNQLDRFFAEGVLRGQRPFDWDYSPRWRGLGDTAAGLDLRARSYLAANCSNCHGDRGQALGAEARSGVNFDFHEMVPRMEFRDHRFKYARGLDTVPPLFYSKTDPANPMQSDTLRIVPALAVPGYPQKSLVVSRQKARSTPGSFDMDQNQMPPLGTLEVDREAVALLEEWVRRMPQPVIGLHGIAPRAERGIRLQGRMLSLDPKTGSGREAPSMASLDGRRVALRRIAPGVYELPAGLPKGLYLIRSGADRVLRYLF